MFAEISSGLAIKFKDILLVLYYIIESVYFLCHLRIPLDVYTHKSVFARVSSLRRSSIGFIHILFSLLFFSSNSYRHSVMYPRRHAATGEIYNIVDSPLALLTLQPKPNDK